MEPWEEMPTDVPSRKWLFALLLIGVVLVFVPGCAHNENKRSEIESRYLTQEEDSEMGKVCGPQRDCVVLSGEVWRQIQRGLKMCGFLGS